MVHFWFINLNFVSFYVLWCFFFADLRGEEYNQVVSQIKHFKHALDSILMLKVSLEPIFRPVPENIVIYNQKPKELSIELQSKYPFQPIYLTISVNQKILRGIYEILEGNCKITMPFILLISHAPATNFNSTNTLYVF